MTTTQTTLGKSGPTVLGLGLGCMGMSGMYGPTDEAESIATIHAASEDAPVLLDTGDFYGMGHNEMLIGRAIKDRRDRVVLSVKFGALRTPDGRFIGFDGRPEAVKSFAAYSLKRLGVEVIDIYRPARVDPQVPIEDTVGAVVDLIKAGYVRQVGLSEAGVDTIRRAHAVHPITDLQIEYALVSRKPEGAIFPALAELGIGATLYGVLSRGLLGGSKPTAAGDFRAYLPRFSGEHRAHNEDLVTALSRFAKARDMTPAQVAIAWVRGRQPAFLPVIGAKTRAQWQSALEALDRPLSPADLDALEQLIPADAVAGDRYSDDQMKHLDSER
ncbi:MAG TPA: aldo/keto reductase [Kofleriaceae bacterium]|nr:aldo/keto reductase [Kofleriaceae bacterium]